MNRTLISSCVLVAVGLLPWAGAARGEEAVPDFREGKAGRVEKLAFPAAEKFKTEDGKSGWKLRVPGGRPLATPAVVDGLLYVGGGFGSHEFYALNAQTGEIVWGFKTGDDGPTAAVVAEGCVAYNTESCTLYVHDAKSGNVLWHRWLGDPLMSQPAIADGRLFMAYPGGVTHHLVAFGLKTGKVLWDRKIAAEVISAPVVEGDSIYAATCDGTLYRFDAEKGTPHWARACQATSAPVIVDGKVHFSQRVVKDIEITVGEGTAAKKSTSQSTLEGLNGIDPKTGELVYKEPQAAVQAAYLLNAASGRHYYALNVANAQQGSFGARVGGGKAAAQLDSLSKTDPMAAALKKQTEEYAKSPAPKDPAEQIKDADQALQLAEHWESLAKNAGPAAAPAPEKQALKAISAELRETALKTKEAAQTAQELERNVKAAEKEERDDQRHDTAVGFAQAPAAANVQASVSNIGKGNVKAIWAYQGSRPCPVDRKCILVNGARFRATDFQGQTTFWETKLESQVDATNPATPPALAGGKVYLGTADGRVLCADPETGKTAWESKVGGRILFQPAVAAGRVYVATNDGLLICLETGDAHADGWTMWGGSAAHNGPRR